MKLLLSVGGRLLEPHTLIGRASAYRRVSLRDAELRQPAGVYRPVRTGCVASADDSLMMIMLNLGLCYASDDVSMPSVGGASLGGVIGTPKVSAKRS
jgi:hypothetical protein